MKKCFSLFFLMLSCSTATFAQSLMGDVNGDNKVDFKDVSEISNYIMGKPSAVFDETKADINGDGRINSADLVRVINMAMVTLYDSYSLVVWKSDGTKDYYNISELPETTFGDYIHVVKTSGGETKAYDKEEVLRYSFSLKENPNDPQPVQTQNAREAFYVYQNDGHFDGFFYDEVQKIAFSEVDTFGIAHDGIVSQEIVTADSTYRFMLTAIDSIGFVQPDVEYCSGVRMMREEGMTGYISSIDNETLVVSFYGSLPSYLCPKVGETLIDFDQENGFGGKVASVDVKDDMVVVQCDPLTSLKDVFRRFICVEQYGYDNQGNMVRSRVAGMPQLSRGRWDKASTRASEEFDFKLFDINIGGHIPVGYEENFSMVFDINAHVAMTLKGSYNINYIDPIYIGLLFTSDVSFGLGVTIDGKLSQLIDAQSDFIPGIPIPASAPIFELRNIPGLFARGEAHLKFSAGLVDVPLSQVWHKIEFNDSWIPSFSYGNNSNTAQDDKEKQRNAPLDTYLEFNGFVQIGVHAPLTLGTNRWLSKICKAEFGTHLYIGPKLSGNIQVNFAEMMKNGPSFYNALKNSALALTPLSIDFETKATMSGWWGNDKEVTFGDGSIKVLEDLSLYLLPQFDHWQKFVNPSDGHEYAAIMCENKSTIMPYQVGVRRYKKDENGNLSEEYTDFANQLTYDMGARWLGSSDPMDHPHVDLEQSEPGTYVLRPLYRVANLYLEGSPEFTYEVVPNKLEFSRDTIFVDWEGKCVSPVTIKGDYDEVRAPEDDNYKVEISGKSVSCNLKSKNYCVFDSITVRTGLMGTKKKANGEVKEFGGELTIIQLPRGSVSIPDYLDARGLRNNPPLETADLVPLSGEIKNNVCSVSASGSRKVVKSRNEYDIISWEFSLEFEVQKCHNPYADTIVVKGGHYRKTIKYYYREGENYSYYLSYVSEHDAPTLNPYNSVNNYWYADGNIGIYGQIDGSTISNKSYDWEGHLIDEYSGEIGSFDIGFVFKDSESYINWIKQGGSVEEQ